MNKSTFAIILVAAIVLYFIAWPVPIDPVAWNAPVDSGLTGVFERNDVLRKVRAIDLGAVSYTHLTLPTKRIV